MLIKQILQFRNIYRCLHEQVHTCILEAAILVINTNTFKIIKWYFLIKKPTQPRYLSPFYSHKTYTWVWYLLLTAKSKDIPQFNLRYIFEEQRHVQKFYFSLALFPLLTRKKADVKSYFSRWLYYPWYHLWDE